MATALYGMNVGDRMSSILVTNPGPATTSRQLEINVDLTKWTNTADLESSLLQMVQQIVAKWHP